MQPCEPEFMAKIEAEQTLAVYQGQLGQMLVTKDMLTAALEQTNSDITAKEAEIAAQEITVADATTAYNTCMSP